MGLCVINSVFHFTSHAAVKIKKLPTIHNINMSVPPSRATETGNEKEILCGKAMYIYTTSDGKLSSSHHAPFSRENKISVQSCLVDFLPLLFFTFSGALPTKNKQMEEWELP